MSLAETISKGSRKAKINIEEVRTNKMNFYEKEIVDNIATSIKEFGQLSNCSVFCEEGKDNKKYTLIDGETRCLAILKLNKEGLHDGLLDVLILDKPKNNMETESLIIDSNLQRTKSTEDRLHEIEKATLIYETLKKAKNIDDGVIKRDWIGKKIGISGRQVQKYLNTLNGNGREKDETKEITDSEKGIKPINISKELKKTATSVYKLIEFLSQKENQNDRIVRLLPRFEDTIELLNILTECINKKNKEN